MKRPSLHVVHEPRLWPFYSSDPRMLMQAPAAELDDEPEDDYANCPYCICGDLPTRHEQQSNKCAACGKPLV